MLLQVHDLIKSFGGLVAVNQLSLKVEKGTILGIIGPNGSGKTTFFNLITGMLPSDSGKVIFNGQEITRLRPHRIARLGVGRTFQIPAPFSKMTVLENVMVSAFLHTSSMKKAKRKAEEVLQEVGLDEKADFQVLNVTLE
ncbi:MAG: ATP-binding cassette domain-containing protein, partial [Deltaproteobacteria bacterium]|nr:ATP-binding cassette domain-containing protein [Deltaproteobacteria bacterium]